MTKMKKIAATVLAMTMITSIGASVYAATENWNDASATGTTEEWANWKTEWETIKNDYEQVSLTPGEDESKLNFAWLTKDAGSGSVKISTSQDMSNAIEYKGTQEQVTLSEDNAVAGYYSNKVTVTDLTDSTTYYYQVVKNGVEQEAVAYTTGDSSAFSFLYVGDPQIGACKGQTNTEGEEMSKEIAARNDTFNWNQTLSNATTAHPEVSFLLSAGDQVNTATNEYEYSGFLYPDAIASLPVSTTIGNHDSKSLQYSYHFNNPNTFSLDDTTYTEGHTEAGSDYYYTFGDALFIMIDTNNYNCATHENVIKKAVEENPDCKWRIITFHQDIYGSGLDHSDSDGIILRTQLTPIIDKYDIDVVLQGHDHTYSRTYQLSDDGQQHTAYDKTNFKDENFLSENNCYTIDSTDTGTLIDPEGTVYFEANSATGSKFYNLIAAKQDYIAERNQTWTPSYAVIDITETTFTFNVYDALTNEVLGASTLTGEFADEQAATSFTIVKQADTTALQDMIDSAKVQLKDGKKYTDASVNAVNDAIAAAEAVVADETATSDDISNALATLTNAKAGLTEDTTSSDPSSNDSSNTSSNDSSNPSSNDSSNTSSNDSSNTSSKDSSNTSSNNSSKKSSSTTSKTDNNPSTGWLSTVAPVTALLSLAGLASIFTVERNKRKNK